METHEYFNLRGTIIAWSGLIFFLMFLAALGLAKFFQINILPASISLIVFGAVLVIFKKDKIELAVRLALAINAAAGFIANCLLSLLDIRLTPHWRFSGSFAGITGLLAIISILLILIVSQGLEEKNKIRKFSLSVGLALIIIECLTQAWL